MDSVLFASPAQAWGAASEIRTNTMVIQSHPRDCLTDDPRAFEQPKMVFETYLTGMACALNLGSFSLSMRTTIVDVNSLWVLC